MIRLVPLGRRHVRLVWLWANHPDIARHLLSERISREEITALIQRSPPDVRLLAIEAIPDDTDPVFVPRTVGALILRAFSGPPCPWGSFEIMVGPRHQQRGYGRRALERVPDLLETWRSIDVIKFGVFADNEPAISLYTSLGYREIERYTHWKNGQKRRAILMSNRPEVFQRRQIGFAF